jgi:hypothetical protein
MEQGEILSTNNYLASAESEPLLGELEEISRMILAFMRTLKS